jgi:hypothetical protein
LPTIMPLTEATMLPTEATMLPTEATMLPTEAATSPITTWRQDTPEHLFLGSDFCSETNKCGLCEGDCDTNDDCEGDLVCYQRDPGDDIPGCDGIDLSSKCMLR